MWYVWIRCRIGRPLLYTLYMLVLGTGGSTYTRSSIWVACIVDTSCGSTGALVDMVLSIGSMDTISVYSNTLTLLNTDLLVSSGVLSISGIHSMTMKTTIQTCGMLVLVVVLGTVFLMVQCCEYIHLY
jgi:heme/copper-type cytochrome/quinol oxidase subunit 3